MLPSSPQLSAEIKHKVSKFHFDLRSRLEGLCGERQTAGDDLCNLFVFVSHVLATENVFFLVIQLDGEKQGKAIFDQVECFRKKLLHEADVFLHHLKFSMMTVARGDFFRASGQFQLSVSSLNGMKLKMKHFGIRFIAWLTNNKSLTQAFTLSSGFEATFAGQLIAAEDLQGDFPEHDLGIS